MKGEKPSGGCRPPATENGGLELRQLWGCVVVFSVSIAASLGQGLRWGQGGLTSALDQDTRVRAAGRQASAGIFDGTAALHYGLQLFYYRLELIGL